MHHRYPYSSVPSLHQHGSALALKNVITCKHACKDATCKLVLPGKDPDPVQP